MANLATSFQKMDTIEQFWLLDLAFVKDEIIGFFDTFTMNDSEKRMHEKRILRAVNFQNEFHLFKINKFEQQNL